MSNKKSYRCVQDITEHEPWTSTPIMMTIITNVMWFHFCCSRLPPSIGLNLWGVCRRENKNDNSSMMWSEIYLIFPICLTSRWINIHRLIRYSNVNSHGVFVLFSLSNSLMNPLIIRSPQNPRFYAERRAICIGVRLKRSPAERTNGVEHTVTQKT